MGRESEATSVSARSPTDLGPRGEWIAGKRPHQKHDNNNIAHTEKDLRGFPGCPFVSRE